MLQKRPPIVVLLGHVDHGKTTLLDFLKKTKITEKEYGGITQKIQAFVIEVNNKKFTLIDTPGHELFFTLRKRGIEIADLALLVIAADEGIQVQTKEVIDFLKETKLPFIVVLNKIDRPQAQPEKVKKELSEIGVILEEWGGDVPCYLISAKTGQGIDELLEGIFLLADIYDFKWDENHEFVGYVLETYKDLRQGNQVMIILKDGVLKVGDQIFTYSTYGKVKKIITTDGQELNKLLPSIPAIVFGFEDLPLAGEMISPRQVEIKEKKFFKNVSFGDGQEYKFLIKGENYGSLEAILNVIEKLTKKINFKATVIEASIGDLIKTDVDFIKTYHPILILFNTKIPNFLKPELLGEPIEIIDVKTIYEIEQKLEDVLTKDLPDKREALLKILKIFSQKESKITLGGQVQSGVFKLKDRVIIKDELGNIIAGGTIISIEKDKVPCKEISDGLCGMVIQGSNLNKVKEGYELTLT